MSHATRLVADDLYGNERLLCPLSPDYMLGLPKSPFPNMKRRWGQPFLGAEPHNTLPAGLLAVDHLPPISLSIRAPGLRHHLVLRMLRGESYPGIQPTTARKAGDSLTFTIVRQPIWWRLESLTPTRNRKKRREPRFGSLCCLCYLLFRANVDNGRDCRGGASTRRMAQFLPWTTTGSKRMMICATLATGPSTAGRDESPAGRRIGNGASR